MQYWITNPNLTPAHDCKVDAAALGEWARSGWQVREDQADPAPELPADAAPTETVPAPDPVPADVAAPDPAPADPVPAADGPDTTDMKGDI